MGTYNALPKVTLACKCCGSDFTVSGSKVKAYDARKGATVKYCSMACSDKGRQIEVPMFTCVGCGSEQPRPRYKFADGRLGGYIHHQKYCSRSCAISSRQGTYRLWGDARSFTCEECGSEVERKRRIRNGKPAGWEGIGRFCGHSCAAKHTMRAALGAGEGSLDKNGYRLVSVGGVQIAEHRYVMEKKIGRKLTSAETVHHKNGNRADNRLDNLELWSSRHGKGQRVEDKVAFAISLLREYPEVAAEQGVTLASVENTASNDNVLTEQLFRSYGSTMAAAIASWGLTEDFAKYTEGAY